MFDPNCIFPTVCIIQWVTAPYPPNVLSLIFSLKAESQKFWTSLISPRVLFLYILEEPRRALEWKCICCVQMKKRGVNDRWMELGLDREMDTFFYLLSCFRNKNAMRIWRVYDKWPELIFITGYDSCNAQVCGALFWQMTCPAPWYDLDTRTGPL